MSKVYRIAGTEQTLDVVLTSFLKEIGDYFELEANTQKQLHTPIPVLTDKKGFHACCGEKPKSNEPLIISPLQMVWCNIVIYLQETGFGEEEIEKIRMLLSVLDEQYNTTLALLEFCLHYCLHNRQPLCLMVTKAGCGKIIGCENMETFYNCDDEDFYINIRLHKILKKALPHFDLSNDLGYTVTVSAKERELLDAIHTNNYLAEVTIKTKNGDIHSAEFCEHLPLDEKKYVQIMNEKSDQTVTIKRQKGKDAFIKRMYHKFFNNN